MSKTVWAIFYYSVLRVEILHFVQNDREMEKSGTGKMGTGIFCFPKENKCLSPIFPAEIRISKKGDRYREPNRRREKRTEKLYQSPFLKNGVREVGGLHQHAL